MENASKALVIAGSTLIAVLLFAVFVLFIKNIAIWPESEDELLSTEQRARFNEEYQVYYKSAMYGVDVVSCLNKALSNNIKYADGGSFFSGDSFGETHYIDVKVTINSKIEESIEVRALTADNRETDVFEQEKFVKKSKNGAIVSLGEAGFEMDDTYLTSWEKSDNMKYRMYSTDDSLLPNIEYSLLGNGAEDLKKMLKHSNNPQQKIKNKGSNKYLEDDGWSSATWTSYLYNFKLKKFTCTELEINPETGLVNLVVFKEIDI